jgi:Zn-dependent protease
MSAVLARFATPNSAFKPAIATRSARSSIKLLPSTTPHTRIKRDRLSRKIKAEPDDKQDRDPPSTPPQDDPSPASAAQQDIVEQNLQMPQEVIARLRDTVFSLDTFFVTSVENYGANGVLFKGNMRSGNPIDIHTKLSSRLRESLGDDAYRLFLLEDQENSRVAVIIPAEASRPQVNAAAEAALAVLLCGVTVATTLNTFGAELFNAALLTANYNTELVQAALPGTVATLTILAAHEIGHFIASQKADIKLAPPIVLPAGLGLLGSLGTITRIDSDVPNRRVLASITAPGPLAGTCVSLVLTVIGLGLTLQGIGGLEVDSASFRESLLIGSLGQATFGDRLFTAASLNCNPLFVAGWAGLIINALQCIPVGELDGGRVFLALFGRRAASRMSAVSFLLLGVLGFNSSLSLFWLLLVLTLQRGPLLPCSEELSPLPDDCWERWASIACLLLPLLVLAPFPGAPSDVGFDAGVISNL